MARLDLPEDKIATYTGQLESILEHVGHLEQVDTTGVPETTCAVEVTNVTRPDEDHPVREDPQPARYGGFLQSSKILAE